MTAPRWPHGARAACAFTFDLDAETLWLARGVTEPVALSQGTFGPAEALPRILELLHQAEIPASFFVPAWVAEHHPDAVKAIVAAGHEVGCHGDVHERVSDLDAAQEEKILVRSVDVLTRQAGRRPVGYRAPAWQPSAHTLPLPAPHGCADAEALAGAPGRDRGPRAGGARLMPLLRGNLHAHTTFSDGVRSPAALVAEYEALGYDFLAITDHEDHDNWVEPGYQRALERLRP